MRRQGSDLRFGVADRGGRDARARARFDAAASVPAEWRRPSNRFDRVPTARDRIDSTSSARPHRLGASPCATPPARAAAESSPLAPHGPLRPHRHHLLQLARPHPDGPRPARPVARASSASCCSIGSRRRPARRSPSRGRRRAAVRQPRRAPRCRPPCSRSRSCSWASARRSARSPLLGVGIFLNGVAVALGNVPLNVESAAHRARAWAAPSSRSSTRRSRSARSPARALGALRLAPRHLGRRCSSRSSRSSRVVWRLGVPARLVLRRRARRPPRAADAPPSPAARPRSPCRPRAAAIATALDSWREPRTLLIGVVVMAAALSEGSANDWLSLAVVDGFDQHRGGRRRDARACSSAR